MNILIADTHPLYRDALCAFLRHATNNGGIFATSSEVEAERAMRSGDIEIFLAEERFSGFLDMAPTHIKTGLIGSRGVEHNPDKIHYDGFFPRSLSSKEFLFGIEELLKGRVFRPQWRAAEGMSFMPALKALKDNADFKLTDREKEVLRHLVHGETNKDIARALGLQVVTIKLHVRSVCRKMKAANRTQAALMAKELGFG
jgi:DNA-binding NarL/FixJ family response regulator